MGKSGTTTFGWVLGSIMVPIAGGVLGALWAYVKERKIDNKRTATELFWFGVESGGVTLAAVLLVTFCAYLIWFIPTIYNIHESTAQQLISERTRSEKDIERTTEEDQKLWRLLNDREQNINVNDPAFDHLRSVIQWFLSFRVSRGMPPRGLLPSCEILFTLPTNPEGSESISDQIMFVASLFSGCGVSGSDLSDPDAHDEAEKGAVSGEIVVHMKRADFDSSWGANIYGQMGNRLRVARSYEMPKPVQVYTGIHGQFTPVEPLIWLQFGRGVRWTR